MKILLTQSSSQDITFTEAKEIEYSSPGYCGTRTYTFSGGLPSYLQLNTGAMTLTLSSSSFADVGLHPITFTVALQNYPMVPTVTKTFIALIECKVLTLSFSALPTTLFIEPGVTTEPANMAFGVTQTPNCQRPTSFTITSIPPVFLSLSSILQLTGVAQVNGVTLENLGTYPVEIKASADIQTVTASFDIVISDACKRAILQAATPSPLPNVILIRDFHSILTQPVIVKTDVEINFGVVCPLTATLVNPPAFVTMSNFVLSADESQTTVADVGPTTI